MSRKLLTRKRLEVGRETVVQSLAGREDLDRDLTSEVGVGSAVHLAHSADANLRGDLIRTEARTGTEGE